LAGRSLPLELDDLAFLAARAFDKCFLDLAQAGIRRDDLAGLKHTRIDFELTTAANARDHLHGSLHKHCHP